ncbi:MAG TPA: peptidase M1 [Cytophagales bacterium]|jgi:aminopeptidase N|nr:peptidase M1 [Cytophagales bacterium]
MKQFSVFPILFLSVALFAQEKKFTLNDTLRGTITPERAWWDLNYYHLSVNPKPETQFISGRVEIRYTVLSSNQSMQIDLQPLLHIDKITQDENELTFNKKGSNAYFIQLKKPQAKGNKEAVVVYYSGNPIVAKHPPWEGGVQWEKDNNGNWFIATSCQGLGSSAWWPCKDHMYDEPDSMLISITTPKNLMDVSNGRLRSTVDNADDTKTWNWEVKNPINNYGVNMNIANYVHFADTLHGAKGVLDMNYYVLPYNLDKAKEQFKQAKLMMKAFEYWFGPYPFYEDGFKLVEVPYLGMEHQSSVTYGNGYGNGYRGHDLSGTGWGLKWDFIIIHESGHEWFANNITYKDIADMWIHESFTNYSEALYTEYYFGKDAATEYVVGTRRGIRNDKPIIGVYNVNEEGSGDMYPKGGNMLHTIRHSINDDKLFREILRGLNKTFYHQTVTTQQIENFISEKSKMNFSKVFDQYLRNTQIPTLEYYTEKGKIFFRWTNCVNGFDLSIILKDGSRINPTEKWQSQKLIEPIDTAYIEKMFYVKTSLKGK